jgi:hypothetical protein
MASSSGPAPGPDASASAGPAATARPPGTARHAPCQLAGKTSRDDAFPGGLDVLGVPVGDQPYKQHHLQAKSDKVSSSIDATIKPLFFVDTAALGALLYYTFRAAAVRALGIPIELAGVTSRDDAFHGGLSILGVPVGDQPYGQHHHQAKSDKVSSYIDETITPLFFVDTAALGALLYYTLQSRFDYWTAFGAATHPAVGGGTHRRRATTPNNDD